VHGRTAKLRQTISKWLKYLTLECCIICKDTLNEYEIEACEKFKNTPDVTLSEEGKRLKSTVSQLLQYIKMMQSMPKKDRHGNGVAFMDDNDGKIKSPSTFLRDFNKHCNTNPTFKNELAIGLIECVIARFNGYPNAPLAPKVINFFHLLESRSQAAFGIVLAQVYGPSLHQMVQVQSDKAVPPIINFSEERICAQIHAVANHVFAKGRIDKIIMSLTIDATATPTSIQLSTSHCAVIGSAAPNHL